MAKKVYRSLLEQYWGFKRDSFQDVPLEGNALDLFIGREFELRKIRMTLRKTVIGITGTHGVGKTSFLRKIQEEAEKQRLPTVYFSPLLPETSLFREFAKTLLLYAYNGTLSLKRFSKSEIQEHLQRFDCRVSAEKSIEGGIDWKIFSGKRSKTIQKEMEPHTEDSAISIIERVAKSLEVLCVVFIDHMEAIKKSPSDSATYFHQMTYLGQLLQTHFLQEHTCFICSLDKEFYSAVQEESKKSGDVGALSYYFNDIVALENFSAVEVKQLIRSRLQAAGSSRSLERFISTDALLILFLASEKHPRKLLRIIEAALIEGAYYKRQSIDSEVIIQAIRQLRFTYDETDLSILLYALKQGNATSTDRKLQFNSKLKERQLRERLASLAIRQLLSIEERKIGGKKNKIFRLL